MLSNKYVKMVTSQIGGFIATCEQSGFASAWFTAPYYFLRQLLNDAYFNMKTNEEPPIELPFGAILENITNDFHIMSMALLLIEQLPALNPSALAGARSAIIGALYRIRSIENATDIEPLINDIKNGALRHFLIGMNIQALQSFTDTSEVNQCLFTAAAVTSEIELILLNEAFKTPISFLYSQSKNVISAMNLSSKAIQFESENKNKI